MNTEPPTPHARFRTWDFAPKAILFDMDGLLVDSEPVWHRAESAVMQAWGAPWTEEHARACTGRGLPETIRLMAEIAGKPLDFERDLEMLVGAFLARAVSVHEKPGARALVEATQRARIASAVASSSPRRVVTKMLTSLELASFFSLLVTGDDVVKKKPEPDIFLLAAQRLGVAPADCLVIEDSVAGATAGRRAGMMVIAVPDAEGLNFDGIADGVAKDLIEAATWIRFASPS